MDKIWKRGVMKQLQNHTKNVRNDVRCCEGNGANMVRMGGIWRSNFRLLSYLQHL
jgi:hypothetical protein